MSQQFEGANQNLEIAQLKRTIARLNEQLKELQERKPITIENVNVTYHFDQLKVETIEGTLNIGVQPGNHEKMHIEDLDVPPSFPQTMKFSNLEEMQKFKEIRERVSQTLQQESAVWLKEMQSQYQCVIGNTYAEQMNQDIQAQMDDRILFYLQHSDLSADDVYERSLEDAKKSLELHVISMKEDLESDELDNRQ